MLYAIIGWCCEVVFAAVTRGQFVNCGTMRGPYCPIYGAAVSLVILLLTPVADNLPLLFICSFAITTAIEFLTGFALEKLVHRKWWDYSREPFNLCGYVCLKMSLLWTIACILVMRVVQPLLGGLYDRAYKPAVVVILCVFAVPFAVDVAFTVKGMIKLRREFELLDEMAAKIREVSEYIGSGLFDTTQKAIKLKEKTESGIEQMKQKTEAELEQIKRKKEHRRAMLSAELDKLRSRYETDFAKSPLKRFSAAFPEMKSISAKELIEQLKKVVK